MDPVVNENPATSKPLYKLGNPFDNIKIIVHTIMGSPRLKYEWDRYNIVAKNFKNEDLFNVVRNILTDHDYAESVLTVEHMNSFADFGKLFNEFGTGALNMIATALMISCGNKTPLCTEEDAFSVKKLGIAFGKLFEDYQRFTGIKDENEKDGIFYTDDGHHLDFSHFVDDLDFMIRNAKPSSFIEFGDVMSSTYVGLTIYLTGVFIKLSETLGINMNTLYGDGNDFAAGDISDRLIKSNTIDNDVKYKVTSLLYLYYLMTEFYRNNLGVDFVDKLNFAFYKIGEKIASIDIKTLEEEMDISYLFALPEEGNDSFMNILNPPSVIENPTGFDVVLRDSDITDFATIALPLFKYFSSNADLHYGETRKSSSYIFDNVTKFDKANESTADILYDHFINNVANVIPASISPKYFYKMTVYAAAFRILKKELTGKGREIAALGLYQADALVALLYKEWVLNESYCREIGTGVCCIDTRYVAKSLKAKAYIKFSAQNYVNFVHRYEFGNDMFVRDNFSIYIIGNRVLDETNNIGGELIGADYVYKDIHIMHNDMKMITNQNYEQFDENITTLNNGKVPLLALFVSDDEKYGYKYFLEVLETDYQQKTMDQLAAYADNNESDYLSIYDSKLARALTNNIKTVLKNEDAKERFDIYFNTFIKCAIPVSLAKNVMDKTDKSDEDFVGNQKPEEKYLPNIRSQRLFNFLEK